MSERTIYPEDIQAVVAVSTALGLVQAMGDACFAPKPHQGTSINAWRAAEKLKDALELITDCGNPKLCLSDPDTLRELADEIERERRAEDEAREATYRDLSRRVGGFMGDEFGPTLTQIAAEEAR